MAEIKNLHLLAHFTNEQITNLEIRALRHRRHANVYFKILKADAEAITVGIRQEKNRGEAGMLSVKGLVAMVSELLAGYYSSSSITAQAVPLIPRPVEAVTPHWVQDRMQQTGTRLNTLASDTGLDKSSLSAIISGIRPMSNITRAMFFFYFQSKGCAASS